MMLAYHNKPGWIYPGAAVDLDFANARYWGGSVAIGPSSNSSAISIQSLVNGPGNFGYSTAYAPDIFGVVQAIPQYCPRITQGLGLWAEADTTNYCLYSRDFTNAAWNLQSMTAARVTGADNVSNSGSQLTATGSNAFAIQSLSASTNTTYTASAYVKRVSGSGSIYISLDYGTTYTDITSQVGTSRYKLCTGPSEAGANPTVVIKIATSGDVIAIDFCQVENNLYPTTPMPCTSSSQERYTDEPAHSDPNGSHIGDGARFIRTLVCSGGPWSMLMIGSGNGHTSNNDNVLSDGGVLAGGLCGIAGSAATANFQANNGTLATTSNTGNVGLGSINKVCGRANGKGNSVSLNGGAVASTTTNAITSTSAAFTHMGLGNNGSAAKPINGYISRLVYWPLELTDGQMMEYTNLTNAYGNT